MEDNANSTERKSDGTFRKGISGNPAGRPPKKRQKHFFPIHNANAAIAVAETPVEVTIDGVPQEISIYRAVLLTLARKAMAGNHSAAREFLRHANEAVAERRGQSDLFQMLIRRDPEEEAALKLLKKRFPDPGEGGTYQEQPDGSVVPGRWSDTLQRLDELDVREEALAARERRLSELEEKLAALERRLQKGDGE